MTSRSTIQDAATEMSGAASRVRLEDLPAKLRKALDVVVDKKGRAPVILQVTDITGYTDFVLIASGRSERHVAALSDAITDELRDDGTKPRATDGFGDHSWDALDYDDFIVHVFYHPVRMHYDLESMWSDAPRVELDLPDDVMDTADLDRMEVGGALPEYRGDFMFGGYEDEFDEEDDDDPFADEDEDEIDDPEST